MRLSPGSSVTTRRKRKSIVPGAILFCALILGATQLLQLGKALSLNRWPQVPDPELYVTTQPKQEDIVGVYQLTQQSITPAGLAILKGRSCHLDLRPDGSFVVTNYPMWSLDRSAHVTNFVSTTGYWHFAQPGTAYWGIELWKGSIRIGSLNFRGKSLPYNLMMTYGDADEGMVMIFERVPNAPTNSLK